jgi:hypothetical protein
MIANDEDQKPPLVSEQDGILLGANPRDNMSCLCFLLLAAISVR